MVVCSKCSKSADDEELNIVHIVQENVGSDNAVKHGICTGCIWIYQQKTGNILTILETHVGNQILTDAFRGFNSSEDWTGN